MPFEQAKRQFETKTNQAPEQVEGNWKDFTDKAKSYLSKKQKQVSGFIDSLDYPNKKRDKQSDLSEMGKAIDDVIDENEATKKEMAKYNGLLYKKSNQLKNKLLHERRAMEVRKTKEGLSGVVSHFQSNGIPLNTADNVKVYLSVAKEKRIPLKEIREYMAAVVKNASSVLSRKEMIKNKNIFYTIFNHYCWGNKEAALKETKKLNEHLDFHRQCDNVREKTGLTLNNVELNGMMSGIIKTGVPKEKVGTFIIKNFAKLQKVGGEDFNKLLTSLNKQSLSRFLLTALISVNEGKSVKALEGIKMTMKVEATLLNRQKETARKLKNMYGYLKTEIAQLQEYRKKHPRVTMNPKIAKLQKEVAVSLHSIAGHKKNLLLIAAKKSLANSFMSMKGMNPSSARAKNTMNEILNASNSQKLELLAVDKCGFAKIPQIPLLQAAEMKFKIATQELEVKKWYEKNPMVDHPLNVHDVLSNFNKTGKLSYGSRKVFKEQFSFQATNLRNVINENEQNIIDYTQDLKDLQNKYGDLSKVPKEKIKEVSMKLSGFMTLLKNMHAASIKLQGNIESLLILSPDDKKLIKEKKYVRNKAALYADTINHVSTFLGLKPNKNISDVDSLVESPLFGPMIQKEINPHMRSMNSYMGKVQDAARPIPYIGKRIQKQAERNPRLVTYRFDQGIGQMVTLYKSMKAARANAITIKAQIEKTINDPSKTKGMPQSMVIKRKEYLQKVLDKLKATLNDPKSPLSIQSIQKVIVQKNKIVAAREKYIREGFWKGVAMAVIMAGAVAFAVAGGWAAGALGAKLFGTTATGTFAAGLIPVGVGVSKFAIGSMSMMGVAAGSVVGSRVAMSGFDALDLVDFGGAEKIWKPEDMMDDYATSFTISLLAIGAAKGAMSALKHVSTAKYFAFRFPGLVKFSRTALNKIQTVSKIASPSAWFQSGRPDAKSLLRHFGAQVGEEMGEEGIENIAGKIHPALEFLVSVGNSADGMNMKLSMNGIKAADVGIVTEGSKMAYTTATPQEFVANFKNEFATKNGVGHDATVNADGTVTLDLFSYDINPKNGEKVQKTFSTITIHPASLPTNITPEVEMTRVPGLTEIAKGKEYTAISSEGSLSALSDLYKRGFNIIQTHKGEYKVSKGEQSFTLKIPQQYLQANQARISRWINTPMKQKAYKKLQELNGSYKTLLKKHPKLAKVLPADLLKLKFIPTNVAGLACGMSIQLKSLNQIASRLPRAMKNLNTLVDNADTINAATRENTIEVMNIKDGKELIRETYFDKATGLMNRNGLSLGENLLRQGKKLSVANFDADHFRASNDIKGREYGDAQIKIIAKNINQTVMNLRKAGYKAYAVRMGGEEFTLMTTAPQDVLHKQMLDMSAKTKQEMLSTLSTEEKREMAEHIAKTKYANDPKGVEKAYSELGGISGSVIGINGKALDWKQKGNMKKALMYADASMEDLKKMHGRGNFELDRRSPTATSERINGFEIHNVLDTTQKGNLSKEAKRLFGAAEKQFDARLKTLKSVISKVAPEQQANFTSEITKVLSSPDSTIGDISKVLQNYKIESSFAAKLKNEYIAALRDHGNYTGARTMTSYQREMSQQGARFNPRNSWKIEIGKFKSINETLGHVGGDAYLTFVYQDVIMDVVKDMEIPFGTKNDALIVSQKGADYHFCFSNEYLLKKPGIEKEFKYRLNKKYKDEYGEFVKRLDEGSRKKYQQERDKWLEKNEQANPDAVDQQYNLYFHK